MLRCLIWLCCWFDGVFLGFCGGFGFFGVGVCFVMVSVASGCGCLFGFLWCGLCWW